MNNVMFKGRLFKFETLEFYMDYDIKEKLQKEFADGEFKIPEQTNHDCLYGINPRSQCFLDAYCALHELKFGETFLDGVDICI